MEQLNKIAEEQVTIEILETESTTDALQAQVDVSQRLGVSCAILLLKTEYEDLYKDLYGEEAVQEIRQYLSHVVAHTVRTTDTVGWFEDGCLCVILRVLSPQETGLVATRLQKQLARTPIVVEGKNLHLAAQVGGVWYSGQRPMEVKELTDQAYAALKD